MPYRRRTIRRRRRLLRRPRRYVRRSRLPRSLTMRRMKIHSFKRTCHFTDITVANTAVKGHWFFKLSDLPDYTEFTNLFDFFRIKGIKLTIQPTYTGSPVDATESSIGFGSIHTAIERNDLSSFTGTELTLMQYDTYKRSRADRGHRRYFRPSTVNGEYASDGSAAGLSIEWNKWISNSTGGSGGVSTAYQGINYLFDANNVNKTVEYKVYATYYIQCKSVV